MTRRHRRHNTQLKLELARTYLNDGGSCIALAKHYVVKSALLTTWIEKYSKDEMTEELEEADRLCIKPCLGQHKKVYYGHSLIKSLVEHPLALDKSLTNTTMLQSRVAPQPVKRQPANVLPALRG